jgi:hypothetical protein
MSSESTMFDVQEDDQVPADSQDATTDAVSPPAHENAAHPGVGPRDEVVAVDRITGTPTVRRKRGPAVASFPGPPPLLDGYPDTIVQQHAALAPLHEACGAAEDATHAAGQRAYDAMVGTCNAAAVLAAIHDIEPQAIRRARAAVAYLSASIAFFDDRRAAAAPLYSQAYADREATYSRIEATLKEAGVQYALNGAVQAHDEVVAAMQNQQAWFSELNGGTDTRKRLIELQDYALDQIEQKAMEYCRSWSPWRT